MTQERLSSNPHLCRLCLGNTSCPGSCWYTGFADSRVFPPSIPGDLLNCRQVSCITECSALTQDNSSCVCLCVSVYWVISAPTYQSCKGHCFSFRNHKPIHLTFVRRGWWRSRAIEGSRQSHSPLSARLWGSKRASLLNSNKEVAGRPVHKHVRHVNHDIMFLCIWWLFKVKAVGVCFAVDGFCRTLAPWKTSNSSKSSYSSNSWNGDDLHKTAL